jgi:hypothetical protein
MSILTGETLCPIALTIPNPEPDPTLRCAFEIICFKLAAGIHDTYIVEKLPIVGAVCFALPKFYSSYECCTRTVYFCHTALFDTLKLTEKSASN